MSCNKISTPTPVWWSHHEEHKLHDGSLDSPLSCPTSTPEGRANLFWEPDQTI